MEINGKIVINNIYLLAKAKNIKIGILEKKSGVSPGYFSKLQKSDNPNIPGADILYKVCKTLSVPVENIMEIDYSAINGTDEYIINFLDVLIDKTVNRAIIWKGYSPSYIKSTLSEHPLFIIKKDDKPVVAYDSKFWNYLEGGLAWPIDNIYQFKFDSVTYYISKVRISYKLNNFEGYEFYIKKDKLMKFCTSSIIESPINDKLVVLYDQISFLNTKPDLKPEIIDIIGDFLKKS